VMGGDAAVPDLVGAGFLPARDGAVGGVELAPGESGAYSGAYLPLTSFRGLGWRVAAVEPESATVRDTWVALVPGAVAMLVVGVVLAALTFAAARRLVRPLRELEARSRKAVDGAFVRALPVARDDEVGRFTAAFNALILRLNALHDVSDLMAGASRTEQVLDATLSALRHIAPSACAAVYLHDTARHRLVLARSSDHSLEEGAALPDDARAWLTDGASGQGPSCPTRPARESKVPGLGRLVAGGPGGGVVIPLAYGPEHLGAVVLQQDIRELTEAEIEMVRTFAGQVAVALRTARLFELEQASRREAEVLRAVAERLASPGDLAEALDAVAAISGALLGSFRNGVCVRDPESFGLRERGFSPGWIGVWDAVAESGAGEADAPLLVADVAEVPSAAAMAEGSGIAAVILVPLLRDSAVTGLLVYEFASLPDEEATGSAALAGAVGQQVSLALENAFQFEQAHRRAGSLETVFRITQTVSSSLQTKVVLNRVLDVVQKIFEADAVSLMTYDAAKKVLATAMARGLVSQDMLYLEVRRGEDVPGRAFETQQPVRLGAMDAFSSDLLVCAAASHGLSSLMCAPLLARGRSIGVITVFSKVPDAYDRESMELLLTFGSQAALAIDAAQMYGREHSVASALQTSLLPGRLPEVPGLELASEYRAASTEAEIGGDYYDVFLAPDGRVVLAMGDVCGKGIAAAAKTSMIKYGVRSLIATGMSPGATLATLNGMFRDGGSSTDIVTVWLGLIDVADGRLVYANGGHPSALVRTVEPSGFERLSPTGPLLGAVPGAAYEDCTVTVPEGGSLLLYTDGVTEARNGNRFFGEGRLRRAMKVGHGSAEVVRALMQSLERFAPDGLRDDVAVLAARRVREGEAPAAAGPDV
ncbi:MAG: GAF domain-containing protein, partial [Actinobacteria bacterium]